MPNRTTITKRASNLGRQIATQINAGKFRLRLDVGYLSKPEPYDYAPKGVVCQGCALAAAAYAIGREVLSGDQTTCLNVVLPKITRDDAAQLECGFERWSSTRQEVAKNGKVVVKHFKARPRSAFFKLGERLRARRSAERLRAWRAA
jgi:hypothetical protein